MYKPNILQVFTFLHLFPFYFRGWTPKKGSKIQFKTCSNFVYASFKFLNLAYSGLVNWTVYIHDFLCIAIRSTDELNYMLYNFYPIRDRWKLGSLGNRLWDGALCIGNLLGSAPRNDASEGVREAAAELTL